MYKTVIFDLDGTLLDTLEDLRAAGNAVCREYGWPEHSRAAFAGMVGHGMVNLMNRLSPPDARSDAQIAETLRRFNIRYAACCTDSTRPCPGIPDLLASVKAAGVRMAVYSNKADDFSRLLIEHFFPDTFALVQGKRDGVPVKPDPAGIRGVLASLGADPASTLFAGDSATDIHTGHNGGLRACGVTWGYRPRASLIAAEADFLADTPEELGEIIRQG